jgi:hypothetical protein
MHPPDVTAGRAERQIGWLQQSERHDAETRRGITGVCQRPVSAAGGGINHPSGLQEARR